MEVQEADEAKDAKDANEAEEAKEAKETEEAKEAKETEERNGPQRYACRICMQKLSIRKLDVIDFVGLGGKSNFAGQVDIILGTPIQMSKADPCRGRQASPSSRLAVDLGDQVVCARKALTTEGTEDTEWVQPR